MESGRTVTIRLAGFPMRLSRLVRFDSNWFDSARLDSTRFKLTRRAMNRISTMPAAGEYFQALVNRDADGIGPDLACRTVTIWTR